MTVVRRRPTHTQKQPQGFSLTKLKNVLLIVALLGFLTNLSLMLRFLFGEEQHSAGNKNITAADTTPLLTKASPFLENNEKHIQQELVESSSVPIKIGHVVSLIKCGKVGAVTGFLDAAAVFRHSIHQQSIHNANVKSKYSYQMHAIVHENCANHAPVLERLGYTTWIVPSPVQLDEIRGEWYKAHVEGENCCGSAEFIKLYAYNLTQHPIVVHWDMDVAVLQPMDDLFDAMLYPATSPQGMAARGRLELQHPTVPLSPLQSIDAFFTRDVTSSQPWEPVQGVQGGFLVARPNPKYLQEYLDVIREGNYIRGRGEGSGWGGGMGYGGFQGAMAYQGIVAYFYDVLHPNTAVELNACRWNQVVADVLWRGPARKDTMHLYCRQRGGDVVKNGIPQNKTDCEDCRVTPIELTRTVHYTACKKPWECTVPHPRKAADERQQYRLNHLTNITTCMALFQKWFELRRDFETKLQRATRVVPSNANGNFEVDSFLGYCSGPGRYIPMQPPPPDYNTNEMYGM